MNIKIIGNGCRKSGEHNSFFDAVRGGFCLYLRICLVIVLLLPTLILTSSSPGIVELNQAFLEDCNSILPAGNYQLSGDINLSAVVYIKSGNVVIDSNGKTIALSKTAPCFIIQSGASLTLKDSGVSGTVTNSEHCVYIEEGSFTLLGGTLTNYSKPCITISKDSVMNMSGGVVSSPNSPCIENLGTFNKSGGTVLVDSSEEGAVGGIGVINDFIPENGTISIGVNAGYPSVTYNISFPVITNLSLMRNEEEDIKEKSFDITINEAKYLFDEREILISLSSDLKLKNGSDKTLPYSLTIGDKTCTGPLSPINLIINNPATDTIVGKIIIDQKDIPAKGEYQAEITYTVTVQDKQK